MNCKYFSSRKRLQNVFLSGVCNATFVLDFIPTILFTVWSIDLHDTECKFEEFQKGSFFSVFAYFQIDSAYHLLYFNTWIIWRIYDQDMQRFVHHTSRQTVL